jgi:uncharacterized membrane protein YbhN (UPF0104 family)
VEPARRSFLDLWRSSAALRTAIRIVVSIALLALLVWRLPNFDTNDLIPTWSTTTVLWLVGSIATLLVAFGLQALRWDAVLVAMGHHLRYRRLLSESLAGQFVSNVLPTAFAGDVVRIARLGRDIDDNASAFGSIAIERLTGWLVLPTISLVAIACVPEFRSLGGPTATALAIDIGTIVALIAILLVAASPRWDGVAEEATGWRRWLGSVHLGIVAIRRRPRSIAWITFAGVAFQVTQCLSIWMAARALDIGAVTIGAAFAFFPPTLIGQNLPVGFGGLGVREGGFVLFFGALGASNGSAVALGILTYLVTVVASSFGAPFLAFGGERRRRAGTATDLGADDADLAGRAS